MCAILTLNIVINVLRVILVMTKVAVSVQLQIVRFAILTLRLSVNLVNKAIIWLGLLFANHAFKVVLIAQRVLHKIKSNTNAHHVKMDIFWRRDFVWNASDKIVKLAQPIPTAALPVQQDSDYLLENVNALLLIVKYVTSIQQRSAHNVPLHFILMIIKLIVWHVLLIVLLAKMLMTHKTNV